MLNEGVKEFLIVFNVIYYKFFKMEYKISVVVFKINYYKFVYLGI